VNKLEIKVNGWGSGTVLLDGKDISNRVSAMDIRIRAGKQAEVCLTMPVEALEIETTDASITRGD